MAGETRQPGQLPSCLRCPSPTQGILMRHGFLLVAFLSGLWLASAAHGGRADEPAPTPEQVRFFETRVRPLLVEHCYKCHSTEAKSPKGGLLLDSRDGVRKGGDSGPVIVPGKPSESLLLKAVRYTDETLRMPPKARLPATAVADLELWIAMGAPDPRTTAAVAKGALDWDAARKHWAFQPIKRLPVPVVKNTAWPQTPVDNFILARLESRSLTPSPAADRRTLIRRATFDLIGLPPTPEEVEAFLADHAPDAFAKVVDRLLASPAYGERWGRHCLAVAR